MIKAIIKFLEFDIDGNTGRETKSYEKTVYGIIANDIDEVADVFLDDVLDYMIDKDAYCNSIEIRSDYVSAVTSKDNFVFRKIQIKDILLCVNERGEVLKYDKKDYNSIVNDDEVYKSYRLLGLHNIRFD